SVATGFIVTRSSDQGSFGQNVQEQFSKSALVYFIGSGALIVMAVLPGFP
ncbi:FHIPEP family type III secretion protein, partial [Treponema pallidum]